MRSFVTSTPRNPNRSGSEGALAMPAPVVAAPNLVKGTASSFFGSLGAAS